MAMFDGFAGREVVRVEFGRHVEQSGNPARSFFPRVSWRAGRSLIAVTFLAAPLTLLAVGPAVADDITPIISPDRIDDVASTQSDPYPTFDNFAWRAFVSLNWPSLADPGAARRPRSRQGLGDPGPRVWETFKSRYELFQIAPDGRPSAPQPWATYEARNPCGAEVDGRAKTLASFEPFLDFNQSAFLPGVAANPLVAQNRTYARYEVRLNEPEYSALASSGWSRGENLPDEAHPAHLPAGSIAVKAAWRLLTAADTPAIRARYYVVENAEVVDVAKTLAAGRVVCAKTRRRAGRTAHRDQDEISAAGDMEHLRARRQRAARRRGRGARA